MGYLFVAGSLLTNGNIFLRCAVSGVFHAFSDAFWNNLKSVLTFSSKSARQVKRRKTTTGLPLCVAILHLTLFIFTAFPIKENQPYLNLEKNFPLCKFQVSKSHLYYFLKFNRLLKFTIALIFTQITPVRLKD